MISTTVNVTDSINYLFYDKHRGKPTEAISVWLVDFSQELNCFKQSIKEDWRFEDIYWGFIPYESRFLILGENLLNSQLCFAKFVGDRDLWHGYPADFKNRPNDKPKNSVLMKWIGDGFISKATYRKIQQGQI